MGTVIQYKSRSTRRSAPPKTKRDLFVWMLQHVNQIPPLIPVAPDLALLVDEFADGILSGRRFDWTFVDWRMIFAFIHFGHLAREGEPHCSLQILWMLAGMGEALQEQGAFVIP